MLYILFCISIPYKMSKSLNVNRLMLKLCCENPTGASGQFREIYYYSEMVRFASYQSILVNIMTYQLRSDVIFHLIQL